MGREHDDHLVSEADAEELLPHGVELLEKGDERENPGVVAVGVAAAAGDDEAVE